MSIVTPPGWDASPLQVSLTVCWYPFILLGGEPRGVLEVYMTGGEGGDILFWVENLHARYFFGSRDLSCILFRS